MFWIFMLFFGGAATFTVIGAYAVLFKILSIALVAAVAMILVLLGVVLWQRFFPRSQS